MGRKKSTGTLERKVVSDMVLTDEDRLFFGYVLTNPVNLAECVIPEIKRKFHNGVLVDYQAQMCFLEDIPKFVNHSSPDTGKSTDIARIIIQTAFEDDYGESLCVAPRQTHLAPIVQKVESIVNQDPFLKSFVFHMGQDKSRQYTIQWRNGHLWNFRIAAPGSVFGTHPNVWCIDGESLITLWNGNYIKICDMYNNSHREYRVKTYDHESNVIEIKPVKAILKRKSEDKRYKIIATDELKRTYELTATENHEVYSECGKKSIANLEYGDIIYGRYFTNRILNKLRIINKQLIDDNSDVYDLSIDGNHNYFANNILISNCIIDEAGLFPISSLQELFKGRMQEGCKIRVYGMINGVRASALYQCAKVLPGFYSMNIPRWKNPGYTGKMFADTSNSCGGINTQESLNSIFAFWGDPVKSLFSYAQVKNAMRSEENDEYAMAKTMVINDTDQALSDLYVINEKGKLEEQDFEKLAERVISLLELPDITPKANKPVMATIDIGYRPDPSVIALWNPGDTTAFWNNDITTKIKKHDLVTFIRLNGIHPDILPDIIQYIYDFYGDVLVGVDIRAYGLEVKSGLIRRFNFPMEKFFEFDSSANIVVDRGVDNNESSATYGEYVEDIRITKEFAVAYLTTNLMSRFAITIPEDPTLAGEMDLAWQKRRPDGRISFNTTYDHHLMCLYIFAMMVYLLEKGMIDPGDEESSSDEPLVVSDF